MHSLVTAMALVSGLAAGDGGGLGGTDAARVGVDFAGRWVGTYQVGRCSPVPIEYRDGMMIFGKPEETRITYPCRLSPGGDGRVKVEFAGAVQWRPYRVEGGQVRIAFYSGDPSQENHTSVLTLRPAGPAK